MSLMRLRPKRASCSNSSKLPRTKSGCKQKYTDGLVPHICRSRYLTPILKIQLMDVGYRLFVESEQSN